MEEFSPISTFYADYITLHCFHTEIGSKVLKNA